jgi:hypothetical protein
MNLYLLFQEGFFVKFESKNLSEKFLAEAEFCKIVPVKRWLTVRLPAFRKTTEKQSICG